MIPKREFICHSVRIAFGTSPKSRSLLYLVLHSYKVDNESKAPYFFKKQHGDRNLRSAHKSQGQEVEQYMEAALRGPSGNL